MTDLSATSFRVSSRFATTCGWLAAAAAAVLLGLVVRAQPPNPPGPPPALVRVAEVRQEEVYQHRLVIGSIYPRRRAVVAAEEKGRVIQAPPDPGVAVRSGDLLAETDDTLILIQRRLMVNVIEQVEAVVAERRSELAMAQRQHTTLSRLAARGATSQQEVDDAGDQRGAAEARLQQAASLLNQRQTELMELDERILKMQVIAPFDGVIVAKSTEIGQWLSPGDAVAELIEITTVDALVDVPEAMIHHVLVGGPVRVIIEAMGLHREGTVSRVVPDAERTSRTFPVAIRLENADGRLKPGMTVSAELPTDHLANAFTVPRDAVWTTPVGSQVYANRGEMAVRIPVQVLFGVEDRFIVELQRGEMQLHGFL